MCGGPHPPPCTLYNTYIVIVTGMDIQILPPIQCRAPQHHAGFPHKIIEFFPFFADMNEKIPVGGGMDFSRLKYISTDAPTTDELELLNKSRVRIAQVIRARWIILGILAVYGAVPYAIFP